MFNVDPRESQRKFDHAAKSLGDRPCSHVSGPKRRRDDDSPPGRSRKKYAAEIPPLPQSDPEEEPEDTEYEGEEDDSAIDDPQAGPSSGPV